LLSEHVANRFGIRNQSVARKFQALDRPVCGFFIASAASVTNDDRDITEVGPMARGRFYSNLGRYADNDKGVDTAISQSEVEPRPFERGHGQFVEDAFNRTRL